MGSDQKTPITGTVDQGEVAKFAAMAGAWWDPDGDFKPLHILNPTRLGFIRDEILRHFAGRDAHAAQPLNGLRLLEIGCGGGLLAEPLTRMGARVTAIDATGPSIEAARAHALSQGLEIDYRHCASEDLAGDSERYDIILSMEVVEHVPDLQQFIDQAAALMKPDGLMLLSTLNRTLKSYALAIVGAEYLLRWVPRGTHDWNKFVKPSELSRAVRQAGLETRTLRGMQYHPLSGRWSIGADLDVNYLLSAIRAR